MGRRRVAGASLSAVVVVVMSEGCTETKPDEPGDRSFSLGLGLTNECNLACSFCYRDVNRVDRLTLDQVKQVIGSLPVQSVNLGTGENGMHPDFLAILDFLRAQPIKLTITSNGHSVAILDDEHLRAFHDVEFSLDYPTEEEQDHQRGEGNWQLIQEQARRCRGLRVPVTITAVMMKTNYRKLADVARVAKEFEAPLRVNVFQSVRTDSYALTYEEYWEGFRLLFAQTDVIAIGEPLVRAMVGLATPECHSGCGISTVRVTPRATTQPCVYWPGAGGPLPDLLSSGSEIVNTAPFIAARMLPRACEPCEFREVCGGGCAGRRMLQGSIDEPDCYCPIVRGERPRLEMRKASARDLPKLGSACTTVVMARDF